MKAHNEKHQLNDGNVTMGKSILESNTEIPNAGMKSSFSMKGENEMAMKAEKEMRGSGFKYYYSGRKLL